MFTTVDKEVNFDVSRQFLFSALGADDMTFPFFHLPLLSDCVLIVSKGATPETNLWP